MNAMEKKPVNLAKENQGQDELYPEEVVGENEAIPKIDFKELVSIGKYVDVRVTDIVDPHNFYIQFRKLHHMLNYLMDDMEKFYKKYEDLYKMPDQTLQPGQICAAKFQNEWHRAVIIENLCEKYAKVLYIDYGTYATVERCTLRFLHRDFSILPVQAVKGSLANIWPAPRSRDRWSKESKRRFFSMVSERDLVAGIVDADYDKRWLNITLTDTSRAKDIHINDQLVEEKCAIFREDFLKESQLSTELVTTVSETAKSEVANEDNSLGEKENRPYPNSPEIKKQTEVTVTSYPLPQYACNYPPVYTFPLSPSLPLPSYPWAPQYPVALQGYSAGYSGIAGANYVALLNQQLLARQHEMQRELAKKLVLHSLWQTFTGSTKNEKE